jgi:DNA replication protein DnaC
LIGEKTRRERAVDEIDKARSRIIGTHKLCKGRGIIEKKRVDPKTGFVRSDAKFCKCKNKFDLHSRFLLSNIPYENVRNQKIYNKKVINEVTSKSFNLRELIIPYVKQIRKAVRNPYGFLFLGKPGTGKTFVGSKILYYAIMNGLTAHSIEFNDFLKILRKNFEENLDSLIKEISNVDILMIDEFGNESKRSDFAIGEFKSLYKRRVENNKPTIMISNYNYLEFKKAYGKSIESVVESHSKILNFDKVPDMRKIKGAIEMDTFFEKIVESKRKRKS